MPRAPRRCPGDDYQCANTITTGRYCPEHRQSWSGERTASSRVTGTRQWQRFRRHILRRDGYRCQVRGPRCIGHADQVDHDTNLAAGGTHLDPKNARAICRSCHQDKTAREAAAGRSAWKRTPEHHPGLTR
jgi:5-methylcytosine-specific restriction protein A